MQVYSCSECFKSSRSTLQNAILSGEEAIACCIISNRDSRDCLELKTDYLEVIIFIIQFFIRKITTLNFGN